MCDGDICLKSNVLEISRKVGSDLTATVVRCSCEHVSLGMCQTLLTCYIVLSSCTLVVSLHVRRALHVVPANGGKLE